MEYSIDDILKAKEVVRNAGYGVSLPDNKLDIAKNIAKVFDRLRNYRIIIRLGILAKMRPPSI